MHAATGVSEDTVALISIPDPVSIYESAKNAGLERQAADAFVSAAYSGWIAFLWRLGAKRLFGLGPALRDAATAQYLTLARMETKGFLTVTMPRDLLDAANGARFETEWQST